MASKILQQHLDSPPFNESWHYRSVIGKLNFLERALDQTLHMSSINVHGFHRIRDMNMARKLSM
jgi:hypothetical protein